MGDIVNSLDFILQDIVEIFNFPEVELVRLSGLLARQKKIDSNIPPEWLHVAIRKLKKENVIHYSVNCFCPHCKEIFYIKTPITKHTCDTCGITFDINILNIINDNNISSIINSESLSIQLNNEQVNKEKLETRIQQKGQIVNAKELNEMEQELKEKSKQDFKQRFSIL